MNFLEKLDALMKKEGLNKRTLSKKSGVPYTTILSFYDESKGYENVKLVTLRKLAKHFRCTLDELADDEVQIKVLDDEDFFELTKIYEESPEWKRQAILRSSKAIAEIGGTPVVDH